MNGRSIFVLLALSLSSIGAAACGSDDSTSQKPTTLKLDGTYRPIDSSHQGAIGAITFTNDKDYVLVPSGCGASDCTDVGTFRLDAEAHTVYLENASTHRTRSIVLDDIKTEDVAASLVKSVLRTADLVDPGEQLVRNGQETTNGQQQLNGSQQQLNDGQQKLAEQAIQLIKTIIEAAMNGQGMKKDDQGADQKQDPNQDQQNQDQNRNDPKKDDGQPQDPNDPNAPKP